MEPVKHRATIICRHGKQRHKWLWVRKPKAPWTLPGGKIEPGETPMQAALKGACLLYTSDAADE